MKQGPQGRGGEGGVTTKMIDRGNEGRGLIEEIHWYRMEPDVKKTNVIYLTLCGRGFPVKMPWIRS